MRKMSHSCWSKIKDERGASIVEAALVTVLLLLMIGGMVDLGGAFQNRIIITNAAREGARTAARTPCKSDNKPALKNAIQQATINEAAGSNLTLVVSHITIAPDPVDTGCATAGNPITVTVTISSPALLGSLWGAGPTITVGNSASMAYAGAD